ncbi:MAG: RICIN domain-containing protein [Acidobacteriota bacterium]
MAVQLTPPVLITFVNNGGENCLQAETAASSSAVNLQPIDQSFETPNQLWQFGDDNRIYLSSSTAGNEQYCLTFQPPAENGQLLIIHDHDADDASQTWDWNSNPPTIINLGATATTGITYVIDDQYGRTGSDNPVQIWVSIDGSGNQPWAAQLVLKNYFQSNSVSKPLVSSQTA